jgi:hypothetical protein
MYLGAMPHQLKTKKKIARGGFRVTRDRCYDFKNIFSE